MTATLTNFNVTARGWLVLHLETEKGKCLRKINLHREGAGLHTVMRQPGKHPCLMVSFRRGSREEYMEYGDYTVEWSIGGFRVQCDSIIAFLLRHVLWGTPWQEMPQDVT